ncbi:outer membrane lipoprotein carrier protein LolA [Pseudonocardia nematodicida]|uniref:Outer membrane lipoprotein carrier protein LolA n=1 Tax=Pseudonocardia nematodicida TaxID=1206997 RepID=A0ABV1KGE7_9PSEU
MRSRSPARLRRGGIAVAVVAALVVALTAGMVATRASAAPQPPPVTPEDLVASVIEAEPVALAGAVAVDNGLGLPAIPGAPGEALADGTSTARVWSDGQGRTRLALPRPDGERTYVRDGEQTWAYDSADRTATRIPGRGTDRDGAAPDPARLSGEIVQKLRATSTVAVDETAEVAGRATYTLVLAPQPGERTVLREIRVAVDAETRTPLQLTVLGTGAAPVLQAGFTDVTFGPQDPSLFTFTPPPGSTVQEKSPGTGAKPGHAGERPSVVGEGWDAVVVGEIPADPQQRQGLAALGTPASGAWGSGRQITTNAGSAILTDDGRVAAGAVAPDVLGEALGR